MKIALTHWNNVLFELEEKLAERGHEILRTNPNINKADIFVVWNESETSARPFIRDAQKNGVKVIMVQHGRWGSSRIFPPFNEHVISDKVCLWGEGDKKRFMSAGTPEDKIVLVGSPILKYLKPRVKHDGINVVFCVEHWTQEVPENLIVAGQLRRLKGVNIISKVLKGEHSIEMYDNPVVSDRGELGHMEIVANVLSKADVVVGISESTFELLAECLDIPVVIADIWLPKAGAGDERYRDYKRMYSPACYREKDIWKLNDAIKYAIKHPEHLRTERKQASIDDAGIDKGDPVENIIKVIESYENNT